MVIKRVKLFETLHPYPRRNKNCEIMRITTGIATTTHIDRHNEQMAKSALVDMVEQIKKRFIPQLIEHDPNQHIGVALYGEVFQLKDGEFALGIVSGIFENDGEKKTFKTGKVNNIWKDYKKYLNIDELIKLNEQNHKSKMPYPLSQESNIVDLLETHLDSTQVLPDGKVYKTKRFIVTTGDLTIEVRPKDHNPQHFHVRSKQRGINARFDISTLELINTKTGKIKQSDIRKIQNFFEINPKALRRLKNEHMRLNS